MVIEHVFVTTLEATNALRTAAEFLSARGFVNAERSAFQVGQPQWTSLEMQRGKTNPAKAVGVQELSQSVRLEFDRGRVVVAASIDGRNRSFWTGVGRELSADSPKAAPHVALLMTIVQGLEQVLAQGRSLQEASAPWAALDGQLCEEGRAKRRTHRVVLWTAIIFAASMIGLVIAAAVGAFR